VEVDDAFFMRIALEEAEKARAAGEVPVGAVVTAGSEVLARGHNLRESLQDPTLHAEMVVLRRAARRRSTWRLAGCSVYVTLEPCAMCAGGLVLGWVDRVVFGAFDPKAGFCGSLGNLLQDARLNHRVGITSGVLQEDCSRLLRRFFGELRADNAAQGL
jgi:tRNA(adenine34) deaminase